MITFVRRHRRLTLSAAALGIGLIVFVLVWFQPQKVFLDVSVDEALPSANASPELSKEGAFETFEHPTEGRAVVVTSDGDRILRLEDFRTSNGPDLVVYLSASFPTDFRDTSVVDDFVDLGQLKGNVGAQNYVIPTGTDLDRYSSVIVWCRRFNVTFGAARLA